MSDEPVGSDEEKNLEQAISGELLEITPEHWTRISLEVAVEPME